MEGTYKVEGDKLVATRKMGDKEELQSTKIKTLTDTMLVTEDEQGNVDEFKKK